jgi:hypothetical protein
VSRTHPGLPPPGQFAGRPTREGVLSAVLPTRPEVLLPELALTEEGLLPLSRTSFQVGRHCVSVAVPCIGLKHRVEFVSRPSARRTHRPQPVGPPLPNHVALATGLQLIYRGEPGHGHLTVGTTQRQEFATDTCSQRSAGIRAALRARLHAPAEPGHGHTRLHCAGRFLSCRIGPRPLASSTSKIPDNGGK